MQPMTNKELEYLIDSMSNEDLQIKFCAAAIAEATNPAINDYCESMLKTHQANYQTLLQALQQHQSVAPMN